MRDVPMVFAEEVEQDDIDTIFEFTTPDGTLPMELEDKIRGLVEEVYNREIYDLGVAEVLTRSQITILWVSKTFGDWTALVSTSRKDGTYFELVYDAGTRTTDVRTFTQVRSEIVADENR